jgi:hypothetical protein
LPSEKQWRQWYLETPHGESLVVVAVDEGGEVVGQEVFSPTLVDVNGRQLRALRLSAPILRKDLRRHIRRVDHPMVGLYLTAMKAAKEQRYSFIYAQPEYAWLPVFRWLTDSGLYPFDIAEYQCLALAIDENADSIDESKADGLSVSFTSEFGEDYNNLWDEAKKSFPINCAVTRSQSWLDWKIGGHLTLEVRDAIDQRLVGYVAVKKESGLLVDMLARQPEDLSNVVTAALHMLKSEEGRTALKGINSLKAMESPTLKPILREFGFAPVDFKFAFVCDNLDPTLDDESIAPERWYLMPND